MRLKTAISKETEEMRSSTMCAEQNLLPHPRKTTGKARIKESPLSRLFRVYSVAILAVALILTSGVLATYANAGVYYVLQNKWYNHKILESRDPAYSLVYPSQNVVHLTVTSGICQGYILGFKWADPYPTTVQDGGYVTLGTVGYVQNVGKCYMSAGLRVEAEGITNGNRLIDKGTGAFAGSSGSGQDAAKFQLTRHDKPQVIIRVYLDVPSKLQVLLATYIFVQQGSFNKPPNQPTLTSPANNTSQCIPISSNQGRIQLQWRNNGDPDNDAVYFYVQLFYLPYNTQSWKQAYGGWSPSNGTGTSLPVNAPQGNWYAWRVWAIEYETGSQAQWVVTNWSMFCTALR